MKASRASSGRRALYYVGRSAGRLWPVCGRPKSVATRFSRWWFGPYSGPGFARRASSSALQAYRRAPLKKEQNHCDRNGFSKASVAQSLQTDFEERWVLEGMDGPERSAPGKREVGVVEDGLMGTEGLDSTLRPRKYQKIAYSVQIRACLSFVRSLIYPLSHPCRHSYKHSCKLVHSPD